MLRNSTRALTAALLVGASALALGAAALPAPALAQARSAAAPSADQSGWGVLPRLADLVEEVSPAVVQITARRAGPAVAAFPDQELPEFFRDSPFREFFGPGQPGQPGVPGGPGAPRAPESRAGGSGFLVDETGVIVTNNHVVENATEVTVALQDGREFSAEVLGTDPKTDLAVLRIEAERLPAPVRWGDSDAARVGDPVFAMGAPFGLGGTVTSGIVSARGRYLGGAYDDFIQVDAPINYGNSGGPLFNAGGEVIGVNSQIYSPTGRAGGNVGIGFAIPADLAQDVVAEIVESGVVERGWLGVSIQPVTRDIAESLGLDEARGALVAEINPDGPAESAGLEVGDVVLRFGDEPIDDVRDLTRAVADADPGARVRLEVLRDGRERDMRVTLAAMPSETAPSKLARAGSGARAAGVDVERLGLRLADEAGEVVVAEVTPGGPAAEAGVAPGDRVTRVNQSEVGTAADAREAVGAALENDRSAVLLQVERDGRRRFLGVPFSTS
jgi:serine protease Do